MPAAGSLVSDQVFATLLEALLAGRYEPGEKLPTQRALAADLGVTMSSLREALKRLEQMGLVEVRHGDAMRVRDWRAHGGLDVIAHLLFRSGGLDAGVLGAILEARELMLQDMAELAAGRRARNHLRRLRDLAAALGATADEAEAQRLDFAFFAELAEAAGNLVFVLVMNAIRDLYFAHAADLRVTARPRELATHYADAVEAIGRGDRAGAREAIGALARRQRARVERSLGA